jgi:hypothetical protein
MPAFQSLNRVHGIKPGAAVLAKVTDASGQSLPALAAQRYGKGRSAAILIGDLWRWSMRRELSDPRDLERAWRQTVRWLVADVPQRIQCDVRRKQAEAGALIPLRVRVLDAEYKPLDNASVTVHIASPDGGKVELTAEPSSRQAGAYEATYLAPLAGAYRARVAADGADGAKVGQRQTGWAVEPVEGEFRTLLPNRALLGRIAAETGGELVSAERLNRFVASLPNRKTPITEPWIRPLWHQPLVFLLALACLIAECGLRRWKGLP